MFFKVSWDEDFSTIMMYLYGKYGRKVFTQNGIGDQLDLNKFSKDFFNNKTTTADISIDSNANVNGRSVIDYSFEFPKPLQKYNSHYLLWKDIKQNYGLLFANEVLEKQISGEIYINDFSDIGKPYCFNYSTYDIALGGLTMSRRMEIKPPKSLESFIRQMEQFTVYAANSTLGATGLADVIIVASYFVDKIIETGYDNNVRVRISDKQEFTEDIRTYVSERFRSFIYSLNWEFRGNQSPFTNISVYDNYFIEDLSKDYVFSDGKSPRVSTIKDVQKIFIEAMNDELKRSDITFPVVTACFYTKNGEIRDISFAEYIAKQNIKFGFINMYYGDTSQLSACCRLRSNMDNEYFNSFGAGSTKIGSLGVVTVNLPRMAYTSGSIEEFKAKLKLSVVVVARINNAKRRIIKNRIDMNSMPLYTLGHMDLSKQYSTYGINGINECLEILGYDITTSCGREFVKDILQIINTENDKMAKRFKSPHNVEQTPSENSAVKLAERDATLGYNKDYVLYSNQFIPLTKNVDILTRLEIQGEFDGMFSGGAICHINICEEIKDYKNLVGLMKYAAKKGVVYWAVNYALRRCENNHIWVDGNICPKCGKTINKTITRVVGFFSNVENWNKTRREVEWKNRQFYKGV